MGGEYIPTYDISFDRYPYCNTVKVNKTVKVKQSTCVALK